jgi:hypothetical protein
MGISSEYIYIRHTQCRGYFKQNINNGPPFIFVSRANHGNIIIDVNSGHLPYANGKNLGHL